MDDILSPLRELWRDRAHQLASNVANGCREHHEIAHAATLFGKDYHDRFLIELIQNANDQAVLGNTLGSTVVVLRAENYLAVSNAGQVVTRRNLERISSIADSDKTGVLVGNKGVGFKAVYQVTDTPEVFSAIESQSGASVFDAFGVGFALERYPFASPLLVEAIAADIRAFFLVNEGLADKMTGRGHHDFWAAVRPELEAVAGFKFPLPRTAEDLAARAAVLRVPVELRSNMQTLVVLPLRDERAREDVKKAVDFLVGAGNGDRPQAELAVLFLPGVSELVVIDSVRNQRWIFTYQHTDDSVPGCTLTHATVTVTKPDASAPTTTGYWLVRADVFSCDAVTEAERRAVVSKALKDFGLESWKPDDPLPVTVALPKPVGDEVTPLGPPGRFCVGLPTEQSTGLPAHVDARFFAKINRDGVIFDHGHGYNDLLLKVAVALFGELLTQLRASDQLAVRRAATLALQRHHGAAGALAQRVYEPDGIADGEVVLAWGGKRYIRRSACSLPSAHERELLPYIADALAERADLLAGLPERELLVGAAEVLQTLGLPNIGSSKPHPWLNVLERAARLNRFAGPNWWEPFVSVLLARFDMDDLSSVPWVPIGEADLAVPGPGRRVFLPASVSSVETLGDDEEVANVPAHVAARLQLVDGTAMRLREAGRSFTSLASKLADTKLVRRPRKTELLEDALFPALEEAVREDEELALDLFAQAIAWVGSMREASRKNLDTMRALVPVGTSSGLTWKKASEAYLGPGWGLSERHERLLADAYPHNRLVSFAQIDQRVSGTIQNAGLAAHILGVHYRPRLDVIPRNYPAPLDASRQRLHVSGEPKLGRPDLEEVYQQYLNHLTTYTTHYKYKKPHDIDEVQWVDGLESPDRRRHVLDLMLGYPNEFLPYVTVPLRPVGDRQIHAVPQLWTFALQTQGWPIFLAEQGVGGAPIRGEVRQVWLLPESARRSAYAHLLDVIPHSREAAWSLLKAVGVCTLEKAPVDRLVSALGHLARRLEDERLQNSEPALSLAAELYSQLEDRMEKTPLDRWPTGFELPLLRKRQLHRVEPSSQEDVVIVFEDDAARARHIPRIDEAFRVPLAREAKSECLHNLFVKTWGASRVLRTSTAKVDLRFTPRDATTVSFLEWLRQTFPSAELAAEIATLLTIGGERTLQAEGVSRNWSYFERLQIQNGSFEASNIKSFYDRSADLLRVSDSLEPKDIVAATWELAGVWSRDLWEGYARALGAGGSDATRAFLHAREISEIEIVNVAYAAGLHRSHDINVLKCALLALHCDRIPATSLDAAAEWWAALDKTPEAIAESLKCPELASLLTEAMAMQSPNGELLVLRRMNVRWAAWQDAVLRQNGQRYRFRESEERYRATRSQLIALVREVASRDIDVDLTALSAVLVEVARHEVPDEVAHLPLDENQAEPVAWERMKTALGPFSTLKAVVEGLPSPPWDPIIPLPKEATKRGFNLYQTESLSRRQADAAATIEAIVNVASEIAPKLRETVVPAMILGNQRLAMLMKGEWAHVYSALAVLRGLLSKIAPETTARLTTVQAFREPTAETALRMKLPELADTTKPKPLPKTTVIGMELTDVELRDDLSAGSCGTIGQKLKAAALVGLDPSILNGTREPPLRHTSGGGGGAGGGGRSGGSRDKPQQGRELMIGDLGEAFVHEWLSAMLGDAYGAEAWRSKARERYGLPEGDDGLGYDFEVADPEGVLFNHPCECLLIEVKSTSTDGAGPFPVSSWEWEMARRHSGPNAKKLYVILRVFEATTAPHIGDVLIDPFEASQRGQLQIEERDLWVRVAQRRTR